MSSTASEPASDDVAPNGDTMYECLVCKKSTLKIYGGSSCGCPTLCATCAMKQGTGGRCKTCSNIFPDVKRIH
ncbi:hypothetical protein SeLEV6574_g06594 [Synchytrium endobioticum]|uniref:RING-type domain-containing protein n=1 Tax=Synchytrium endobioticum TaxID=286115 RepID=A0A507CMY9_9FUNG|nr:hypothetical protein SeLEV6574_g06594 [Synchytrium endobioticum]